MRNTLAIARKELNLYFTTPLAYVIFCVITVIASYMFVNAIAQFMQYSMMAMQMPQAIDPSKLNLTDLVMSPLIGNIGVIFIFVMPFLSMRLLSEEMRQNTFELLMTSPVRSFEIVAGKFMAGLAIVGLTVLFTMFYPVVLHFYGSSAGSGSPVEWSTVLGGYFGLFCWGAASVAIGLFISSLTDSQAISAIVTLGVLLLLWILGWGASQTSDWLHTALTNITPIEHLRNLTRGELGLKDLLYFASLIVLGVFLSQRSVESRRWA